MKRILAAISAATLVAAALLISAVGPAAAQTGPSVSISVPDPATVTAASTVDVVVSGAPGHTVIVTLDKVVLYAAPADANGNISLSWPIASINGLGTQLSVGFQETCVDDQQLSARDNPYPSYPSSVQECGNAIFGVSGGSAILPLFNIAQPPVAVPPVAVPPVAVPPVAVPPVAVPPVAVPSVPVVAAPAALAITGDNSNIPLLLALGSIAFGSLALAGSYRRRSQS